jgi:hypothetical protein
MKIVNTLIEYMVDPNPKGRKYKLGEIVLTPYPAEYKPR